MSKTQLAAAKQANFEKIILQNGLTVIVHTMKQYKSVHAIFATNFGGVDREYTKDGITTVLPAGIAHFLEHKMFENEEGDAFTLYAKTGASANAYTSFDKTAYIFTASGNVSENLDILLSFVSQPYFTKETVQKEQGIIGQEIKMYDDSAEWQLLMAALRCMYKNHYIKDDIAGSVETISDITPQMLYDCTEAFYNPSNMVLAVAGNVTMDEVLKACDRADIKAAKSKACLVVKEEPQQVVQKEMTFSMKVAKPHLCIGYKELPFSGTPQQVLKKEMATNILTELLCGNMTPLYRKLYDENLVAPGFSGDFINLKGATCALFTGETSKPDVVKQLLLEEIEKQRKNGVDKALFELSKKLMYGEMVQDLENVDDVAGGLAACFYRGYTPAEAFETLAELTANDVDEMLQTLLLQQNSVTVTIMPTE